MCFEFLNGYLGIEEVFKFWVCEALLAAFHYNLEASEVIILLRKESGQKWLHGDLKCTSNSDFHIC